MMLDTTTILIAFIITLIAHIGAKYVLRYLNKFIKGVPMIIVAIILTPIYYSSLGLIIILITHMPDLFLIACLVIVQYC